MTADGRLLLGVDGGNTKSIALVAREDGTVVGAARTLIRADIHAVPVDQAIAALLGVAGDALAGAGPRGSSPTAAFSLAGADWPEDVALLERRLAERFPGPTVVNDAIGALRAAVPGGPGVVVVCGTGAATGARGPDGRTWHSSFWQEPQGAHELGVRALQAIYRAELGIDPPTELTARLLEATGEPNVESLLHHRTGRDVDGRRDAGVYATLLLDAAEAGDATALEIVRAQGASLGETAAAAARRVGIPRGDAFALALTGGVFRHRGRALAEATVAAVRRRAPSVEIVMPTLEPAVGALLLAFDAAGIPIDAGLEARLRASLPPADLYDTHPAATAAG
ncbi:MAG TPA: BadF/BadG/BcrA/BcrD ATPase family protein [Candidatus Limnocylindrales bacterium]|nr:BadF/BadG/BcrA/BcrD ATPase family protein [Candidatus Limnocylindrales bacterium]